MDVQINQQNHIPNTNQLVILIDQTSPKIQEQPHQDITNQPHIPHTPTTPKTLHRLNISKPKSRFETNYPAKENLHHKASSDGEQEGEDSDDDEIWFENEGDEDGKHLQCRKKRKRNINRRALIEFIMFLFIMTCLIPSLTIPSLTEKLMWKIEIWKWCLLILVLFCGRLVSGWVVGFIVFLIERNFMLREKVLYFVYGLRKSFQNCVWLGLALCSWMIIFHDVHKNHKVLKKLFRFLVAILIGATIWLLKIVFVKVLASSFHVATFFDRMKESVFHHFILDALSGPPLDEGEREAPHQQRSFGHSKSLPTQLRDGRTRVDMERLRKLSTRRRATAWSVKRLVSHIMSSGLSTISTTVDDFGDGKSEIGSEWEARSCAQRIFKHVAKPTAKYIEEEDMLRFLKSEEVHTIFPLFEGALETGRITKSSFRNWVVHAYVERKALAHSLNDTKTAVQQLHKLASTIVTLVIIVISLLVMGLATTKVIFVVTSQLLLVGFMFQNTCKTIFESIIFVFVMHPFDVGDRCVVDGVQMIVEEMNILSTVFLRYDMEKIYYPNSVLLTKPISNFRRSPDMGDSVDFTITIDISTSLDLFNALKKAIQIYVESKPTHWSPKHTLLVREIEEVNKMKLTLCVLHTMNHQNYGEKSARRSELVFELKKILENLGIRYHLLPQEIHLTQLNLTNQSRVMTLQS
ncbi:Mechanosensitive ion channel family protein [Euphorbia peplus]|nr:Mechanosensitive ion channel family protein [Euphorbia peplus]